MINNQGNSFSLKSRILLLKEEEKTTKQFYRLANEYKLSRLVRNDIRKKCEEFMKTLADSEISTVRELSGKLRSFYKAMENHFKTYNIYQTVESNYWQMMKMIEKYLTGRLNKVVFQHILTEEADNDATVQKQIHDHYWVTLEHLESKVDLEKKNVKELLDLALLDLNEINFKNSTLDKIDCIIECSKRIHSIINACPKLQGGADDFLPILMYVVLKANPPCLKSNIKFIKRFSHPDRLLIEEEGYYFSSLYCVVNCIENFSAKILNLSEQEYKDNLPSRRISDSDRNNLYNNEQKLYLDKPSHKVSSIREKMNEIMKSLIGKQKDQNSNMESILVNITEYIDCEDINIEVEEAVEMDESYAPKLIIDDVIKEYVIIDVIKTKTL